MRFFTASGLSSSRWMSTAPSTGHLTVPGGYVFWSTGQVMRPASRRTSSEVSTFM